MTFDRRKYARLRARQRHEKKVAALNATRRTCAKRFGRWGECGGVLQGVVRPGGRVELVCPRCERLNAGLCMDCPARVSGQVRKARRCARCAHIARNAYVAKYRENNRALVDRRAKLAAQKNRQRNADYKRLWRAANPEKVAAQKRRYYLRQPKTAYDYQRVYRLCWYDPETHQRPAGPRHCLGGCGSVVTGRAKKCADCKAAVQRSAQRILAKRRAA